MDVNSLTIDYRKMKKLTAREKLEAIQKAPNAPSFLASLTPTQLAQLFPDYFRRQLPDIGKATTGATPMSRSDTGGTTSRYTPPTSPGLKTRDGRSIPGQDPGALMEGIGLDSSGVRTAPRSPGVKMSWEDSLNAAANEKRIPPNSKLVPNKSGKIDATALRKIIKYKIAQSKLNGFKPPDGERYGIKNGTPAEWANYLTGLAQHESGLKVTTTGDIGKFRGNSNGLYQLSPDDALNYKLQETPFTIDQLQDPNFNLDIAIKIHEHWIVKKGQGIFSGAGRYWGPISKEGWTPGRGRDANLPWDQWAIQDASAIPEQDPSKTGGTDLDAMHKAGDKEPITAIPEGLDEGAKKFLGTLTPEKQQDLLARINEIGVEQANKLYQDSREAEPEKASTSVTREVTGQLLQHGNREAFDAARNKYVRTKGLDETLITIGDAAIRTFEKENPGYKVRVISGKRTPQSNRGAKKSRHLSGGAVDYEIIDPNGKALDNLRTGSGKHAGKYGELMRYAEAARIELAKKDSRYEGWNVGWGGMFGDGFWMDTMHMQKGGSGRLGTLYGGFHDDKTLRKMGISETVISEVNDARAAFQPVTREQMEDLSSRLYGEKSRLETKSPSISQTSAEALSFSSAVQAPEMSGSQSVDPYKVFDEKGKPIQKKEGETARPITVPQEPKQDVLIGQPQIDVGRTIEAEKKSSATPVTPPQQKPTIPVPKQDPGALLKGLEKTPSFFAGGETQVGEDMALVNKQTGEVTAHLNSTERVQVTPQHRTSDEDIQKISKQREAEVVSQAKEDTAATTKTTSPTPRPKPQQRDQNLILDENRRLSYQSADKYKTASNQRAMARSRFMEIASDPIVGHFSDGAANMK